MEENTGASESVSSEPSAPAEAPQTVDAALDSFSAQMMAEESAAETPEPAVTEGEAPTTAEPPADPALSDAKQGPIPFAAHKTALENARLKAAEETQQRLVQEWQTQIEPIRPYVQALVQDVSTGEIGGLEQVIKEYLQHPVLGGKVRSMFGRALSQLQQRQQVAPQAPTDTPLEADLQTADGALVFSADRVQALVARERQKILDEVRQEIKPFHEVRQQQETQQRISQQKDAAMQWATSQLQEFRADPDFTAHEKDVRARMEANPQWSLDRAWQQVYRDVVVPKKLAQGNVQYLEAAAKKSRGSAPDPGSSAPAQPRRARSIDEALDQVYSGA
jgi:hypothetical protein